MDILSPIIIFCYRRKIDQLLNSLLKNKNKRGSMGAEHHAYKLLSTQLWIEECLK